MKYTRLIQTLILIIMTLGFISCSTIPKGAVAVHPFNKEKYLGKWYEIARLDNKFERGLNNTTAAYSLNDDGSVKVVNRGFNDAKNKWKQAVGKAKFAKDEHTAMLKVSFFGPFYSGYNVIALDTAYKYAMVSGERLKYLWILSRDATIPEHIKNEYLNIAEEIGFDTSSLLWIEHDKP